MRQADFTMKALNTVVQDIKEENAILQPYVQEPWKAASLCTSVQKRKQNSYSRDEQR